jgi:DNA-binding LytR/AlgR family response regulator
MKQMNCIVVDDDLMARKSLNHLCKKVGFLNVLQLCENGKEGLEALQEHPPDLIFLDMEMPEVSGIEFLELAAVLPQIIFFTSRREYAFEGFEYQVTDFLEKPATFPRFLQAVNKAYKIFIDEEQSQEQQKPASKEFYIRENGKLCRVHQDDILYFENVGDYIRLATTKGNHIIHGTLKGMSEKINNPQFIKVHRSYIINLDKIKDIEDNSLVIKKKVIPISRANKALLMSKLNML